MGDRADVLQVAFPVDVVLEEDVRVAALAHGVEPRCNDLGGLDNAGGPLFGDIAGVEGPELVAPDPVEARGTVRTEEVPVAGGRVHAVWVSELGFDRLHEEVRDPESVLEVGRVHRRSRVAAHLQEGEDVGVPGLQVDGVSPRAETALVRV